MFFLTAFDPYPDAKIFSLMNYDKKKIGFRQSNLCKLNYLPSIVGQ